MKSFNEWRAKPWRGTKNEILQHWNALPQDVPIASVKTVPSDHKGSTYSFDGIRITGSPNFINSIISKLKNLLAYDTNKTQLDVVYEQQVDSKTETPIPGSYVFHVQIKQR